MKCEICHQADAAKAIRREGADGEEDELYVCEACARAERQRRQRKSSRTRKVTGLPNGVEMSVTEVSGDGDGGGEPPPIVGAILNAFQDMVNDLERASNGGEEKKDERKLVEIGADGADAAYRLRGGFHLEGLHLIGELDAVRRALHAMEMELVGVEADGVKDAGHVYRIGHYGDAERAGRVAKDLVREERNARVRLFEELPRVYGDSLCRALAILKNCRLLSQGEYFDLLSPLRLAAKEKMLDGITFAEIERTMAKLDLSGGDAKLEQEERDRVDAERADAANRRFEDVMLNERAEEKFL